MEAAATARDPPRDAHSLAVTGVHPACHTASLGSAARAYPGQTEQVEGQRHLQRGPVDPQAPEQPVADWTTSEERQRHPLL